jgi:hypothetical protein
MWQRASGDQPMDGVHVCRSGAKRDCSTSRSVNQASRRSSGFAPGYFFSAGLLSSGLPAEVGVAAVFGVSGHLKIPGGPSHPYVKSLRADASAELSVTTRSISTVSTLTSDTFALPNGSKETGDAIQSDAAATMHAENRETVALPWRSKLSFVMGSTIVSHSGNPQGTSWALQSRSVRVQRDGSMMQKALREGKLVPTRGGIPSQRGGFPGQIPPCPRR